jgi:hypothetical protein
VVSFQQLVSDASRGGFVCRMPELHIRSNFDVNDGDRALSVTELRQAEKLNPNKLTADWPP